MSEVIRAPELTGETLDWYNVHAPLTLEQLRGRLVILDFWTFCCVNCMNAVPSLQQLQTLFPEELVVIGVHSPKFAAEMDPQRLIAAMERLDITHPVIHDPLLKLWEAYCIKAWPSLVIISPQGRIVDVLQGEPDGDMLMVDIAQLLAKYHQQGLIKKSTLNCCDPRSTSGRYRFPSGLKPVRLEDGQPAWALCDSGHHQVVLLDDSGKEIRRLGSGTRGFLDGDLNEARFDSPQGLIFAENDIYVADTANHAIRHISLSQNRIETIAGIGLRGDPFLSQKTVQPAYSPRSGIWNITPDSFISPMLVPINWGGLILAKAWSIPWRAPDRNISLTAPPLMRASPSRAAFAYRLANSIFILPMRKPRPFAGCYWIKMALASGLKP